MRLDASPQPAQVSAPWRQHHRRQRVRVQVYPMTARFVAQSSRFQSQRLPHVTVSHVTRRKPASPRHLGRRHAPQSCGTGCKPVCILVGPACNRSAAQPRSLPSQRPATSVGGPGVQARVSKTLKQCFPAHASVPLLNEQRFSRPGQGRVRLDAPTNTVRCARTYRPQGRVRLDAPIATRCYYPVSSAFLDHAPRFSREEHLIRRRHCTATDGKCEPRGPE